MIAFDTGLIAYADRYLLARAVSKDYANSLRARVASFCRWAGDDVPIHVVNCELANEWLAELAEGGMSAWSLSGYRGALLAVWKDAYQAGDNTCPPLRVRKITKPRLVVEAYTHTEIRKLLAYAARLTNRHRDGNRASDFWQAAIHVAYCCGPRRGDLLAVEWRHVSPAGVLVFVQHKTNYQAMAKLSADAMKFAKRLKGSGKLLPWPYYDDWFSRKFSRIRDGAGITRGSFKWVRRSAGSYAEREERGSGAKLLGHRDESVFRRFYEDTNITGGEPIEPPPLGP